MLKCSAAEILDGYKLFRYALAQIFGSGPHADAYVKSAFALCSVLDTVHGLVNKSIAPGAGTAQTLRGQIECYLPLAHEAHSLDNLRLKHHQMTHLPDQMEDPFLTCFVTERKNKRTRGDAAVQNNPANVASI